MMADACADYIHANALVLGEQGLLLRGPSGSGKSALSLALIAHYAARGDFARLVGDDRVSIAASGGRLVARPHPAIAGMIEVRGLGLPRVDFEAACVLHAVIDIRGSGAKPARLPEEAEKSVALHGIVLPCLGIEACGEVSVARIAFFLQLIATI
jgi:HPr kinase/phosphorylase